MSRTLLAVPCSEFSKSQIGFRTPRQILGLVLAVCVPLIVFGIVTTREDRFVLGSLFTDSSLGGKPFHLVGMSFLGDPMVWGFTFLVPFLIAVLDLATKRTLRLINTSAGKATQDWRNDASNRGFARAVSRAKQIWKMHSHQHPFSMKFLHYGPWVVAIFFWAYNTLTCDFLDFPQLPNPYTSDRVTLIPADNASPQVAADRVLTFTFAGRPLTSRIESRPAKQIVELSEKIPLRKWDCERATAPWSFWLTRLWTALFYGALPFWSGSCCFWYGAPRRFSGQDDGGRRSTAIKLRHWKSIHSNRTASAGSGSLSDAVIIYLYCVSILASLVRSSFATSSSGRDRRRHGQEPQAHRRPLAALQPAPQGDEGWSESLQAEFGHELVAFPRRVADARPGRRDPRRRQEGDRGRGSRGRAVRDRDRQLVGGRAQLRRSTAPAGSPGPTG